MIELEQDVILLRSAAAPLAHRLLICLLTLLTRRLRFLVEPEIELVAAISVRQARLRIAIACRPQCVVRAGAEHRIERIKNTAVLRLRDAGEIGAGQSVTALYEIVPAGTAIPTNDAGAPVPPPAELRPDVAELELEARIEARPGFVVRRRAGIPPAQVHPAGPQASPRHPRFYG